PYLLGCDAPYRFRSLTFGKTGHLNSHQISVIIKATIIWNFRTSEADRNWNKRDDENRHAAPADESSPAGHRHFGVEYRRVANRAPAKHQNQPRPQPPPPPGETE